MPDLDTVEKEIKEIMVEANEYDKAEAPDFLCSGGLGPCIAVGAIYGKRGYMAHTSSPGDTTHLDKLLQDLKKDVKNTGWLKIYVAGGGGLLFDEPEEIIRGREDTMMGREKCLERIAEAGFAKHTHVEWASSALTLDLTTRKAIYEEDELLSEYFVNPEDDDYS